jgi:Predicted membrane GTPase involved in stress response
MCRRIAATRQRRFQLQISALDYNSFVGRIGVGRINAGTVKPGMDVLVMEGVDGNSFKGRVNQVLTFQGLDRVQVTESGPGDIVLINGIADIGIGVTLTDPLNPAPLPMLKVDEPTLTMNFCVNTSPLAGREGNMSPAARSGIGCKRTAEQCGAAGEGDRRRRHFRSLGPRRTALDDSAGEHAPRRLRTGGVQAACGVQGRGRRAP